MTAPLTPADCDLRDFQFMPLDVVRLRDSDLVSLESAEACLAAILLWGAAWHQVPAASLPDDDRVLAKLAGYGRVVSEWLNVREGALRNFVLCEDGRLYHPIVAEKAVDAWQSKLERMWRTECARIKKQNQRMGTDDPCPSLEDWLSQRTNGHVPKDAEPVVENVPEDTGRCPPGNGIQGTGRGTGTGKPKNVSDETSSGRWVEAIWQATPSMGKQRSSKRDLTRALSAAVNRGKDPPGILEAVRAYYASHDATKNGGEYAKGVHRLIENDRWEEWADDPLALDLPRPPGGFVYADTVIRDPSEKRQRAWMQEFAEHPGQWRTYERGPRPGEPGCQVAPEIQREFGVGVVA